MIKFVNTGAARIQPYRAGLRLAEFCSIRFGNQRQGQTIDGLAEFFASQVNAGGDIPPLIRAADLQFAIEVAGEHIKIKRLQQHVTELGIADAYFAVFHARANAFFGDHLIDREVLADVPQEIEVTERRGPIRIVDQTGGIGFRIEIE